MESGEGILRVCPKKLPHAERGLYPIVWNRRRYCGQRLHTVPLSLSNPAREVVFGKCCGLRGSFIDATTSHRGLRCPVQDTCLP